MSDETVYVAEGWWHPNVKSGRVHDHHDSQPATMHRLCEQAYTRRTLVTKTGRVLTQADIEALADEAERGYDVSHLTEAQTVMFGDADSALLAAASQVSQAWEQYLDDDIVDPLAAAIGQLRQAIADNEGSVK